jgi:hypothetical protein
VYNVDIADRGNGTYFASYTVVQPGTHTLEVTYDGMPIRGSPFVLVVVPGVRLGSVASEESSSSSGSSHGPTGVSAWSRNTRVCSLQLEAFRSGWWDESQYRPYGCDVRNSITAKAAHSTSCLGKKHMLFIGDSLMRCLYWTFLAWLNDGTKIKVRTSFSAVCYVCTL